MLWVEKYRPHTFDEVVGNESIVEEIKGQVETGEIGHMMFVGPAGIGKTTIGKIIANEIFDNGVGSQLYKESNASDERGVGDIRDLKRFARKSTLHGKYKIVFLDEADQLTREAQTTLRYMMEGYSETCKFILSGNFKGQFLDPIQSRCAVFDFDRIRKEECLSRLRYICQQEDADVDDKTLKHLTEVYRGDLRGQINKLESLVKSGGEINLSELDHVQLYSMVTNANFMGARKKANVDDLRKLYYYMMDKDEIPGRVKARLSIVYAKYDFRVGRTPDKQIQVNAWIGEMIEELQKFKK